MLLIDVRPFKLTGSKVQMACDEVFITLNKNTIVGDKSALTPGGLRVGTCAITTRGYQKDDVEKVAEFLDRIIRICVKI
jgi:glycine hydroxymethyltransferase